MTVGEIYKVLGVLAAVQEKQNQDQEAMDRRMNNTSGWKGI